VWKSREERVGGVETSWSICVVEDEFAVSLAVVVSSEDGSACVVDLVGGSCFNSFERSINWLWEMGFPGFGSASVGSSGRWSFAKSSGDASPALTSARTMPGVIVSNTMASWWFNVQMSEPQVA